MSSHTDTAAPQAEGTPEPAGEAPNQTERRALEKIRSDLRYDMLADGWRAFWERSIMRRLAAPLTRDDGTLDDTTERLVWQRTWEIYQERGQPLHGSTLAWWWREWPKDKTKSTGDSFSTLLDLNYGPVVFKGHGGSRGTTGKKAPPGLKIRQAVFVRGQRDFPTESAQLDDFCKAVAGRETSTRLQGVTCLAGVRGSGKSTILNRAEWFCRNPEHGQRPPLCMRLDLGMSFNHDRFARDLIDQICREARKYCDEGPFASRMPGLTTLVTAIGNIGRWCDTNIRWAGIVLLLLFGLIGTSQLYTPQRSPAQQLSFTVEELARGRAEIASTLRESAGSGAAGLLDPRFPNRRIELPLVGEWKVADIHFLGLALIAIMVIGGAHALRRALPRLRPRNAKGWQWLGALALMVPLLVAADALYLWVGAEPVGWRNSNATAVDEGSVSWPPPVPALHLLGAVSTKLGVASEARRLLERLGLGSEPDPALYKLMEGYDGWYKALIVPFSISVLLVAGAILALPRWWEHYLRFRHFAHQLQPLDDGRLIPLPYVGALLAQVLPQSEDYEEADKISMPFVQWRTKQVLEECVHAFGRVVILIDDVDILPSAQYHELLRLLRPISKTQNVCCVLAVPELFFDAWGSTRLNDAHSTIAHCLVVGEPDFYSLKGNRIHRQTPERCALRKFLIELLQSRLSIPLADDSEATDMAEHPLFQNALRNWRFDGAIPEQDQEKPLLQEEQFSLENKGLSRRAWLRILRERLPDSLTGPMAELTSSLAEQGEERRQLNEKRRELEEIENLFRCEARWWSEFVGTERSPSHDATSRDASEAFVLQFPGDLAMRVDRLGTVSVTTGSASRTSEAAE